MSSLHYSSLKNLRRAGRGGEGDVAGVGAGTPSTPIAAEDNSFETAEEATQAPRPPFPGRENIVPHGTKTAKLRTQHGTDFCDSCKMHPNKQRHEPAYDVDHNLPPIEFGSRHSGAQAFFGTGLAMPC